MFFYKNYDYSIKATLCSMFFRLLAVILACSAIFSIANSESIVLTIIWVIIMLAIAVFCYTYLGGSLPDKIAEKDFNKKITTDAGVGLLYCTKNPDKFDEIAAINPAFAAKYTKNEDGKIVKIKKNKNSD